MVPRRSAGLLVLLVAAAVGVATTGCTAAPDRPARATAALESVRDDARAPTRSTSRVTLRSRLLTAGELPGVTRGSGWTEHRTARREPDRLASRCHRFPLVTVGAAGVAHRAYRPLDGSGARAAETVARFPDARTAWRVLRVLEAWHETCAETLHTLDEVRVGPLRPVDTGRGDAHWYVVRHRPRDDRTAPVVRHAHGLVLLGNRLALLRMTTTGPDLEPHREPMPAFVRAAAGQLL
jgi:hypothetical protein